MLSNLKIVLLTLSLLTIVTGCDAGGDPWDEDDQLILDSLEGDDLEIGEEAEETSELPPPICGFCDNCVLHARCLQPRMPFGLTSWASKVRIINRAASRPSRGCVAMIRSNPTWGHAAYVQRVWSNGTITINEANWRAGQCGTRRGRPAALNVRGYWCPR